MGTAHPHAQRINFSHEWIINDGDIVGVDEGLFSYVYAES